MSNLYDGDVQLVQFLRELADSIESKKLQQEQLKCIGEFYMNYKMSEEIFDNSESTDENDYDEMDIVKFLTMGWYIYTQLINKDSSNPTDNETPNVHVNDPD